MANGANKKTKKLEIKSLNEVIKGIELGKLIRALHNAGCKTENIIAVDKAELVHVSLEILIVLQVDYLGFEGVGNSTNQFVRFFLWKGLAR